MKPLSKIKRSLLRTKKEDAENSNPTQPPLPAQPTASNTDGPTAAATSPSQDPNPWARAFGIIQIREPELMSDYKKHLASLQGNNTGRGDLSAPQIESIVRQLLKHREETQFLVFLLGKPVEVRKQAEKLVKFLLWTEPIVKNALSAQPHAALAWSGVSMLLPVGKYPNCELILTLEAPDKRHHTK
jgi:hypothetical protein